MKRFFTIVFALCLCAVLASGTSAQSVGYSWSVSHSSTDLFVNTGLPNGGVDTLYLWFACSTEGMSAAEMTLDSIPPGQVIGFNPLNGFLNAGNATSLLLAVGGCPLAPVVAGSITILHFAALAICLGGANVTVDCSADPQAWPHDRKGYADLGLPLCLSDSDCFCCIHDSVEESSWGTIKSLYR